MALNLLDELIERVSPYARALGITKNEVKLYVTLLMEGPLTGKELAQRLGISQVKVYPMLDALLSVVRRSIRSLDVALAHRALIDDHLVRALEEASKRASVRVLLEHGIELSMPSRVEVKVRKGMFGSGAVGDNSIVLVIETGNVMGAIISNHQFFVSIGRIYFDHLWETA